MIPDVLVKDLTKRFGGLTAVDDVSMTAEKEMITLLMGPNGSGKTTLINCITGALSPDSGRVEYRGNDVTRESFHDKASRGLVRTFQIPSPFRSLTLLENLLVANQDNPGESVRCALFGNKWKKVEDAAINKAVEILKFLELGHLIDQPAASLSGGQLKLLELGRVLMADPTTLLLDEPVGSVNQVLAHKIFAHVRQLRESRGITFLIVEHRLDIAMQYVDAVYVMANGQIISSGSPQHVIEDPRVIASYLGGDSVQRISK
jgi:branched-chain amino acid transport system ATP-binding protein